MASTGHWAAVETLIRDAGATGGVVGVAVHGAEGVRLAHHGDRRFRVASTIKAPLMSEAYRGIDQGTRNLEVVNATMQSLGMTNSLLSQRILGHLPKPGDSENWATPRDFAPAVQAIVANEAASPESREQMPATLAQ